MRLHLILPSLGNDGNFDVIFASLSAAERVHFANTLLSKTKDRERTWLNNVNLKQVEINAVITCLETDWYAAAATRPRVPTGASHIWIKMSIDVMEATLFAIDRLYAVSMAGASFL